MNSRLNRIAIAAVGLKVLLLGIGATLSASSPALEYLDKATNFLFLVLAAVSLYRFTRLARSGALWSVSRKLLLSYLLIGAVPILLLITFSLLAFLLVFFDVSTYIVQNRFIDLTEQASTFAKT